MDKQFRKYHEARLWLKAPSFIGATAHNFAKFYAGSDWDDPAAAWREFSEAINRGE